MTRGVSPALPKLGFSVKDWARTETQNYLCLVLPLGLASGPRIWSQAGESLGHAVSDHYTSLWAEKSHRLYLHNSKRDMQSQARSSRVTELTEADSTFPTCFESKFEHNLTSYNSFCGPGAIFKHSAFPVPEVPFAVVTYRVGCSKCFWRQTWSQKTKLTQNKAVLSLNPTPLEWSRQGKSLHWQIPCQWV